MLSVVSFFQLVQLANRQLVLVARRLWHGGPLLSRLSPSIPPLPNAMIPCDLIERLAIFQHRHIRGVACIFADIGGDPRGPQPA